MSDVKIIRLITGEDVISKTKEKYILTGWYNFKGDRK